MMLRFLSNSKASAPPASSSKPEPRPAATVFSDDEEVRGLSDLYSPEPTSHAHVRDAADILLEMGKITDEQYGRLRRELMNRPGVDAAMWLLKEGWVKTDDVLHAKAKLGGLEFRHILPEEVEKGAFEKLDIAFIQRSSVVPVAVEEDSLLVATSEPANVFAIEDVKRQTGMNVRVVVCSADDINAICESFKVQEEADTNLDDIINDMTEVEVVQDQQDDSEDLESMAGQSPVIKFVNYLISNAIREGASDIHIEPKETKTRIRYRIDGVLFEAMQAPIKMHPAIVSRIKIMANLDISERRVPQDGKVSAIVGGRAIDLRISTLPTNRGEKTVIRVLDSQSIVRGLEHVGMEADVCQAFAQQVAMPHGILLVTGPTGSGKSTTLYSALCQMDGERLNISTVEDPVEYELDFCNQVHVNERAGLTFAAALRSLLRQDPDVIMIGEIRDNETARIAVQAALTGHLVLSTLHTNDAASSVTRLVNIGIDAYLIAASLNAAVAQRLVRRICPKCKETYKIPDRWRRYVERVGANPNELVHGAGCEACRGSGYSGRVGIFEMLVIDDKFRDIINQDASVASMRRAFHASGQPSLFEDGMQKVKKGLTTVEEVLRVTEVYGQTEDEVFVENLD
ncbi:MAG: ATPase, T2SS/T4P/T4SS family [Sedimentisphaerales bacterium]|jgi:type IV pilus assembly protein PilB|nr:ATPase, T2SS/T4P/T4SS family [Sedimentisphaerales bacterium]HNY80830.1 ATPase, T2SS/T4P/T4SS family [Sedimentisphaerales bacterium]HOC65584.1 ATPase, T2SS/T4P/T4SS family [Sedimentisphaerales bacterium]HOH66717.1 ATPase, T2SS/T4P/T4SS family [Sedimentisphaerales bacterium]HPY48924.1 ATPase, T2SS/T4P/T4SS family [Sedimentisphaerales bacterium]